MEEVKILYLNAETMESLELGQLLVNRLQFYFQMIFFGT